MTDNRQLDQLQASQARAVELARRDLAKLWGTLQQLSPEWQRDMLLDYVPQLVAKYGDLAAQAAYEWYMRVRGESVPESWEYDLSDSFPGDGIDKTIRWQAGHLWTDPQTMQAYLVGAMQRWVMYSGRETIARLCEHDPSEPRYARVPRGAKTCAFCTMLCSRGWVYRSEKTAKYAKGSFSLFHDDCDCQIVPEWDRDQAHIEAMTPTACTRNTCTPVASSRTAAWTTTPIG